VRATAIDVSPAALAIAKENAERLSVAERVEFIESDLLVAMPADRKFDFIASNPPYITTEEFAALSPEVRDHEPQLALVAGPNGMSVIERLIPQAAERLRPGGALLLEISPMLQQRVESLLAADPKWDLKPTTKDLAGHARVVVAQRTSA
jgi:release factor glutamine methyltransferase